MINKSLSWFFFVVMEVISFGTSDGLVLPKHMKTESFGTFLDMHISGGHVHPPHEKNRSSRVYIWLYSGLCNGQYVPLFFLSLDEVIFFLH